MIYIIGGPARTGKTMIRKKIMDDFGIEGICTDYLRTYLELSYPESGINHLNDPVKNMELGFKYVKNFILSAQYNGKNYVIEGDMIDPAVISEEKIIALNHACVFLGYSTQDAREKLRSIRANEIEGDWTKNYSDNELVQKIESFIDQSKLIEARCKKTGLPYLDLQSLSREELCEKAITLLGIH